MMLSPCHSLSRLSSSVLHPVSVAGVAASTTVSVAVRLARPVAAVVAVAVICAMLTLAAALAFALALSSMMASPMPHSRLPLMTPVFNWLGVYPPRLGGCVLTMLAAALPDASVQTQPAGAVRLSSFG